MYPWRVIYCSFRSEISIAEACANRGLEIYCPRYKIVSINRGSRREVLLPFLCSYVFVRFDGDDPVSWHDVMGIRGAIRLLPGYVFDEEMDSLRNQVGDDGELSYEVKKLFRNINIDDKVRLSRGPFSGQDGIISNIDDDLMVCAIEIALLGRILVVYQPLAWCEPEAPAASSGERLAESSRSKRRRRRLRSRMNGIEIISLSGR